MTIDPNILPKYWLFKQAILTLIKEKGLKVGDKLPSLRNLAKEQRLSIGTVRKAIDQLVAEGVVSSRQGLGIFVKDSGADPHARSSAHSGGGPASPLAVRKTIRFCPQTSSPDHNPFWRRCIAEFEKRHPHSRVEFVQGPPEELSAEVLRTIDVVETGGLISDLAVRFPAADLSAFSSPTVAQAAPKGARFFPLHATVGCLIYNTELLRALGMAPPDYTDFGGQMAFLETLSERLRTHRDEGLALSCNIPPYHFLGGVADRLIRGILHHDEPSFGPDALEVMAKSVVLKKIFFRGRKPDDYDDSHFFMEGKAPIFPAMHYQTLFLAHRRLPFEFGAHPFFAADNTIDGTVGVLIANAETEAPVECVRFIRHLLSDESQACLSEGGFVTCRYMGLKNVLRPLARYSPENLDAWAKRILLRLPASREERDLTLSVIEPELYSATDAESFLQNVWAMGKGYTAFDRNRTTAE
ncbi:MAG: GntR family transcriptional regulator [Kiritimatiellae bacterium]|nr:GntR family transcriptional regulator [Kiritimatiellia bacterium]